MTPLQSLSYFYFMHARLFARQSLYLCAVACLMFGNIINIKLLYIWFITVLITFIQHTTISPATDSVGINERSKLQFCIKPCTWNICYLSVL